DTTLTSDSLGMVFQYDGLTPGDSVFVRIQTATISYLDAALLFYDGDYSVTASGGSCGLICNGDFSLPTTVPAIYDITPFGNFAANLTTAEQHASIVPCWKYAFGSPQISGGMA